MNGAVIGMPWRVSARQAEQFDVYVMAGDGSNFIQVTDSPDFSTAAATGASVPRVSFFNENQNEDQRNRL